MSCRLSIFQHFRIQGQQFYFHGPGHAKGGPVCLTQPLISLRVTSLFTAWLLSMLVSTLFFLCGKECLSDTSTKFFVFYPGSVALL